MRKFTVTPKKCQKCEYNHIHNIYVRHDCNVGGMFSSEPQHYQQAKCNHIYTQDDINVLELHRDDLIAELKEIRKFIKYLNGRKDKQI